MSILEVEKGDGFVTIALNDPDRRNLLSPEMVDGLYAEVEAAERDAPAGRVPHGAAE